MAIETNGVDRVPLIKDPAKVFDIFNANDLLKAAGLTAQITAPDGIERTPLLEDARYVFHAAFTLPLMLLPITTNTTGALATEFVGSQARSKLFVADGDADPIFWGREVNQLILTDLGIIDIGNSGAGQSSILLNLVGGSRASRLTFTNVTFARFEYLGHATDFTISFNPNVNLVSIGRGFAFDMSPYDKVPGTNAFLGWRLINADDTTGHGPYIGFTGTQVTTSINSGTATMSATDEFIRMDNNNDGTWDLVGNAYDGIGAFISEESSAANTLYALADLVIDSFSDSTEDPGVDTTVNLADITIFRRGSVVRIGGEAAYNGLHNIVRVADDQLSFDINVVHSTSGSGNLKQTLVTSVNHNFILNEQITIAETVNYNGATVANYIQSNNSYQIPVAFVSGEIVGTATGDPKTHASAGVTSRLNGEAEESTRIASGSANGNTGGTTFSSADIYIGINFGTVTNDSVITERFTLTNDTIGLYQYNDPRPITVRVDATLWVSKTGAAQNYRFALDKNADAPMFTTSITSVTDSSGLARFNFTSGPDVAVGQKLVVKDFAVNTDYNGEFIVTAAAATYFETGVAFGSDEAVGLSETPYSTIEVKTTSVMTQFTEFMDIVENDTLRIRIAPDGHTEPCTATDLKLCITGL